MIAVLALIVPLSASPRLLVPEKFRETEVLVIVPLAVPVMVWPVEESVALNDPLPLVPLIDPFRFTVIFVNKRVRFVTGGGGVHPTHSASGWSTASFVLETSELASSELLVVTDPDTAVELLLKFAVAVTFWLGLLTTIDPVQFPVMSGTWAKPDCGMIKPIATRLKTAIRVTGRDILPTIVRFSIEISLSRVRAPAQQGGLGKLPQIVFTCAQIEKQSSTNEN